MWEAGLGAGFVAAGANIASAAGATAASGAMMREAHAQQTMLAQNAHSFQVADMRRAGLNPILSATGGRGASAPSAAMGQAFDARPGDALTAGWSGAASRRLMKEQAEKAYWETRDAENRSWVSDWEKQVLHQMMNMKGKEGNGPAIAAAARMEEIRASGTAAQIERELDQAGGEATRFLRRLGITGGSAAQILNVFRGRAERSPLRR